VSEPTVPVNFLGMPRPLSDYERARYVVMPIPYDASSSWRPGARYAPAAVIAASEHLEYFDEELGAEYHTAGIATLEPLEQDVTGPEAMCRRVERAARKVVRDGKTLIGLGGEHTITFGLVEAVRKRFKNLCILQVDAHADLRDEYQSGRFSHGCVMRRIAETGTRIVGVGIRSISKAEHRYARKNSSRIVHVTARQCAESEDWLEMVLDALGEQVYVTIDIDGLDPSVAPGAAMPEPGGLDWYQICSLLRAVAEEKRIVAADVVEVCPVQGQGVTEYTAARLIYKLICYMEHARQASTGQGRSKRGKAD